MLDGTGIKLEAGITLLDDDELDILFGNGGRDWFFADPDEDRIIRKRPNEVVDLLD